jgi:hypothetical protein
LEAPDREQLAKQKDGLHIPSPSTGNKNKSIGGVQRIFSNWHEGPNHQNRMNIGFFVFLLFGFGGIRF